VCRVFTVRRLPFEFQYNFLVACFHAILELCPSSQNLTPQHIRYSWPSTTLLSFPLDPCHVSRSHCLSTHTYGSRGANSPVMLNLSSTRLIPANATAGVFIPGPPPTPAAPRMSVRPRLQGRSATPPSCRRCSSAWRWQLRRWVRSPPNMPQFLLVSMGGGIFFV
jgi:hypothetical protein